MSVYPRTTSTIWQLIKAAVIHYPKSLKNMVVFIVLAAFVQAACFLWLSPISNAWVGTVIALSLSMYFAGTLVYSAHLALKQQATSLWQCAVAGFKQWPRLFFYALTYLAIFAVMMYWLHLLLYLGTQWAFIGKAQPLWDLLLAGVPLLLANLMLLMALPLLVTTHHSFFYCLKRSCALAWKCRLKAVFVLYLGMSLFVYITLPDTAHGGWLIAHHAKSAFDLVAYLLLAPLLINYMLLLLNDLEKS